MPNMMPTRFLLLLALGMSASCGEVGPIGPQGQSGPTGPAGPQGPAGAMGTAGTGLPQLSAATTYYVSPSGNDMNDGLSLGTAFAKVQRAVDAAAQINLRGFPLTIQIADGTYMESVVLRALQGTRSLSEGPSVVLRGNVNTPASVTITGTSGAAISASGSNVNSYLLDGLRLVAPTGGSAVLASQGAQISLAKLQVSGGARQLRAMEQASLLATQATLLVENGATEAFVMAEEVSYVSLRNANITFLAGAAYGVGTFWAAHSSSIALNPGTLFTGAANVSGPRFNATGVSSLVVPNGCANLPGTVAGTTASNGICY